MLHKFTPIIIIDALNEMFVSTLVYIATSLLIAAMAKAVNRKPWACTALDTLASLVDGWVGIAVACVAMTGALDAWAVQWLTS